jgi:hypothetical protein
MYSMAFLHEELITCPYCGESITVLIDPEDIGQEYIEDCQVCCKPINFSVSPETDEEPVVFVRAENDIVY